MSGLLISGALHPVPGVVVIGPHELHWSHLSPGDYRQRKRNPHQVILHTTKGDWPQKIVAGVGPVGRAERVAEFWSADPTYSGAHIVVGSDGVTACLADLALVEAYHATVSNPFAIGIEIYQEAGGVIYQAAIDAAVKVCLAISELCGIQLQCPRLPYSGHPLARMADGGKDAVGFFGHHHNTDRRGRGDPGEAIFMALAIAGAELYDFDRREDLSVWMRRQQYLVNIGERIAVDGIPGPGTTAAMKRRGFANGHAIDQAARV